MKAIISKRELVTHRKHLLIAPPSKKLAETAQVTVSAAEQLSVTGPGFRHDMNCEAMQWGTVRLPYTLWRHIIENLVPILNDKEIPITAENYQLQFGKTKIENPRIMVTRLDRLALEIPGDVKPIQIIEFALGHDIKTVRQSAVWKTVKASIDEVRKQFERAAVPIKKYGVTPQDIAQLVAEEIGDKRARSFYRYPFS